MMTFGLLSARLGSNAGLISSHNSEPFSGAACDSSNAPTEQANRASAGAPADERQVSGVVLMAACGAKRL